MKRHFWIVLILIAAFSLGVAMPAAAQQYKPEFKNSLVVGPTGPWGEAAAKFAELLKERTQGRINVKNYFAGQLFAGKQTNEFTLLNQGVADFALGSTINWSPQVKELNLFAMPFMFPSYKALDAVQAGEPGKKLFKLIEDKGVIPLAWGENGFRQVTNSKRPVRSPADLDGLKIRVVGSPIFIDTFRALGANPMNMNWGEAQTAFQQGTVDGQENPVVSVITPYKLWTTQKHITLWNYAIDPVILGVSKLTWESLNPQDREIVRKTALEVMAWQKKGARAGLEGSTEAVENLKRNGMEVVTLSAKDLEAFRAKTRAVYDKWVAEVGVDLVKSAEKIVAATK
ncbi:MAG: DctP family TRAP transporter solute-binding subunit [Candidatus Rokubacteria bacterium]|nr:DctP family TRAP transporter solute-binding subunit [Candidatus Rokubacteria bacterium]